jgi:ABC-2 type transport system permease protein
MPRGLVKFRRLLAMEWSKAAQYRLDMLLWSLTEASVPLISLAVWYRVATQGHSTVNGQDIITYYIFIIFINLLTSAWSGYFLSRDILSGEIVKYLIRPFSVIWDQTANNVAEKMLRLIIPLPVLIVAIALAPHFFSSTIYQPAHIAGFIISLLFGMVIAFVLDLNIGVIAFWLEDVNQLRSYKFLLQEITSGTMIPFVLLPAAIHTAFSYLPFRYIISLPAELLLGQVEGSQAWQLLGVQVGWMVGLSLLLAFLWKQGLKNYAPPGQ